LYIDEVHRFQTPDLATLISEARKFRISTSSANQVLNQLFEENRASMLAAGNLIVFRVSGEDAKTLAKSFDTTPTQEIIGEEPIRAPVSDVISHLVNRGHNDPRVVRFAQGYLQILENFLRITKEYYFRRVYRSLIHEDIVDGRYLQQGRELLNKAFYRCMAEGSSRFLIPTLALYVLAVAQQDRSEDNFLPFIKDEGLTRPYYFQEVYESGFGKPSFIDKDSIAQFLKAHDRKGGFGYVSRLKREEKEAAAALINMITELRYTMTVLSQNPILVDTGSQYQPKYQNRTFADMENEIARDLTNQPNYQAKVKLLSGEHTIQTKKYPPGLTGKYLEARIEQITEQTRKNYCKPRTEVEREISERQDRLKAVENKPNPTSTKATQPQRTRRHRADEIPPAWS
jgi:hypothetical protein